VLVERRVVGEMAIFANHHKLRRLYSLPRPLFRFIQTSLTYRLSDLCRLQRAAPSVPLNGQSPLPCHYRHQTMLLTTIVLLTLTSTLSLSPSLLIFGQGYTASQFTSQQRLFHQITSTTRTGTPPSISYEYDSPPSETLLQALSTASHVLITAPPPALLAPYPLPALLTPSSCPNLTSISFISTVSSSASEDRGSVGIID